MNRWDYEQLSRLMNIVPIILFSAALVIFDLIMLYKYIRKRKVVFED